MRSISGWPWGSLRSRGASSGSATACRERAMLYAVAGILAVGLLAYLVLALLKPELFS